jgi:hypothetical protein
VPLHFEHRGHFTEDGDTLEAAFTAAGVADRLHRLHRLHRLKPGGVVEI